MKDCDFVLLHCTTESMAKRGFMAMVHSEERLSKSTTALEKQTMFLDKARDGLEANKNLGALYTVSVWMGLAALLSSLDKRGIVGSRNVLMYSYGSGSTAALFPVEITSPTLKSNNISDLLEMRVQISLTEYETLRDIYKRDVLRNDRQYESDSFSVKVDDGWFLLSGNL
jgi:3-hydroxy-3-methylglutaryl CoA synthase